MGSGRGDRRLIHNPSYDHEARALTCEDVTGFGVVNKPPGISGIELLPGRWVILLQWGPVVVTGIRWPTCATC